VFGKDDGVQLQNCRREEYLSLLRKHQASCKEPNASDDVVVPSEIEVQ
jgi:hypothetical protein